jgi:hypothetical protein
MRPHLQRRLNDMGREVPALERYGCAIEMARKWRRRTMF